MNRKIKVGLVIAIATVAVAGAGFAIAQHGPRHGMEHGFRFGRGTPPSPEMMGRMLDGRIAGVKAALRLSPEQEKLWPAVEQAVRDAAGRMQTKMAERRAMREEMQKSGKAPDVLEMIERGSQRTAEMSAQLKGLGEALRPLHATLTDEQKEALRHALRPMRFGHRGMGWRG